MSAHLDLDELSDALAGGGEPESAAHLASCRPCERRVAELRAAEREVRACLARLPVPDLPDGLLGRLQAALAEEPPLPGLAATPAVPHRPEDAAIPHRPEDAAIPHRPEDAAGPHRPEDAAVPHRPEDAAVPHRPEDAAVPDGPEHPAGADRSEQPRTAGSTRTATVTPLRPRRRWQPAAAAAVLLVAVGGAGYSLVTQTGGGVDTASSASESGDSAAAPESAPLPAPALATSASGTDYAVESEVRAVRTAVLAGGADRRVLSADGRVTEPVPAAGSPGMGAGAAGERSSGGAVPEAPEPVPDSGALGRLREPAALQACLSAVLPDATQQPLALDYADYAGQPALAVWLADPDPSKLSVFVVGAACSAQDAALLYFTRTDRSG